MVEDSSHFYPVTEEGPTIRQTIIHPYPLNYRQSFRNSCCGQASEWWWMKSAEMKKLCASNCYEPRRRQSLSNFLDPTAPLSTITAAIIIHHINTSQQKLLVRPLSTQLLPPLTPTSTSTHPWAGKDDSGLSETICLGLVAINLLNMSANWMRRWNFAVCLSLIWLAATSVW